MTQALAAAPATADAAKCQLAAEVLRSFGSLRLGVTGCSMMPSIWSGDLLEIRREDPAKISIGDVILFGRGGRLFAHRVEAISVASDAAGWITRGDGLDVVDAPVKPEEFLGKVTAILRGERRIEPRRRMNLSERVIARMVRRSAWVPRIMIRIRATVVNSGKQEALCAS
jgi:signal peptidase I